MSEVWQDSELNEQKAQCRVALEITGDPDTWRLVIPLLQDPTARRPAADSWPLLFCRWP